MEIIEKKWTQLLINWLNKCVSPKPKVSQLGTKALLDLIKKYKEDICEDELDRNLLNTDDLEPFIKYKYPKITLSYSEDKNLPAKLYIMTSLLLFHCCANSRTGAVDMDICSKMDKTEQEWILKFCENLIEMEITVDNVACSIRDAYDSVTTSIEDNTTAVTSPRTDKTSNLKSTPKADSPSTPENNLEKGTRPKFKSSVTVMSTAVETSQQVQRSDVSDCSGFRSFNFEELANEISIYKVEEDSQSKDMLKKDMQQKKVSFLKDEPDKMKTANECGYICPSVKAKSTCCTDSKLSKKFKKLKQFRGEVMEKKTDAFNWKLYLCVLGTVLLTLLLLVLILRLFTHTKKKPEAPKRVMPSITSRMVNLTTAWICEGGFCQQTHKPIHLNDTYFTSFSRCTLLCMDPPVWPQPVGYTYFSKQLIAITTQNLGHTFESVPSESVREYLIEAFNLFLEDLNKLEKINFDVETRRHSDDTTKDSKLNDSEHLSLKKTYIHIYIESDPDPRIRLYTDESYTVKMETMQDQVQINITSPSFCGVRHGLETLSQMILLDQSTGMLITLGEAVIKDAPSFNYRGLMIDTGRNYIPVNDLLRTIDAMATCKLNTFHWRITDVTSFPLYIPELYRLFKHGAYSKTLAYTIHDIKTIVQRAGVRGIRVVMEVAVPGPVGRPWAWMPYVSCPEKNENFTCKNVLCVRLNMRNSVFDILERLYLSIIELTKVDDIFHLSNGIFSLTDCYYLIDDRQGFLENALERLKSANKGVMPKLPIVWYTAQMNGEWEMRTWDKKGVQLHEWVDNPGEKFLSNFKVIHSSRWDLSCETRKQRCTRYRTWQEMYAWKTWRQMEAFSLVGGEALLWTDLVDSGNLDYHIWPRAAAVAERLWSDVSANNSATGRTYVRLDAQRWRMKLRGIKMPPIWPLYCSFSPGLCMHKI